MIRLGSVCLCLSFVIVIFIIFIVILFYAFFCCLLCVNIRVHYMSYCIALYLLCLVFFVSMANKLYHYLLKQNLQHESKTVV